MKKGILASYWDGLADFERGESYGTLVRYFLPELVTALVLYSALYWVDAFWIAELKSTSTYSALGVTNTMLHFIVKFAEGLMVGSIIIGGQHCGAKKFTQVGKTFVETFWVMIALGALISSILYFGADWFQVNAFKDWYLGTAAKMTGSTAVYCFDARGLKPQALARGADSFLFDKLKAYPQGIRQIFGKHVLHIKSKGFTSDINTNLIERFHSILKERTKVLRASMGLYYFFTLNV